MFDNPFQKSFHYTWTYLFTPKGWGIHENEGALIGQFVRECQTPVSLRHGHIRHNKRFCPDHWEKSGWKWHVIEFMVVDVIISIHRCYKKKISIHRCEGVEMKIGCVFMIFACILDRILYSILDPFMGVNVGPFTSNIKTMNAQNLEAQWGRKVINCLCLSLWLIYLYWSSQWLDLYVFYLFLCNVQSCSSDLKLWL